MKHIETFYRNTVDLQQLAGSELMATAEVPHRGLAEHDGGVANRCRVAHSTVVSPLFAPVAITSGHHEKKFKRSATR